MFELLSQSHAVDCKGRRQLAELREIAMDDRGALQPFVYTFYTSVGPFQSELSLVCVTFQIPMEETSPLNNLLIGINVLLYYATGTGITGKRRDSSTSSFPSLGLDWKQYECPDPNLLNAEVRIYIVDIA